MNSVRPKETNLLCSLNSIWIWIKSTRSFGVSVWGYGTTIHIVFYYLIVLVKLEEINKKYSLLKWILSDQERWIFSVNWINSICNFGVSWLGCLQSALWTRQKIYSFSQIKRDEQILVACSHLNIYKINPRDFFGFLFVTLSGRGKK